MKLVATILITVLFNMCYGQKTDTVKVIMLYSDTALTELVGVDEYGEEYETIGYDENTYWRNGFVVKVDYNIGLAACIGDCYHEYFFDSDKKSIPKTNVVWQYKEIR